MSSGIYQIRNVCNDKIYVGSAVNFEKRWRKHRRDLQKNRHFNEHLQNAWNKYGEENFLFEILEEFLNKSFLTKLEQYYIDYLEPEYNINENAGRPPVAYGENHWNYGKHHSKEARLKQSLANIGRPPCNKGRSPSDETRAKMRAAKIGKKRKPFSEDHKRKISFSMKKCFGGLYGSL